MRRLMFYIPILALVLVPSVSHAQVTVAGSFGNSLSLWVAIVIGALAGLMVLRNAHKIGPSVLRTVYNFFGAGMLVVVLGLIALVLPPWAPDTVIARLHDALFILGFGLMVSGAGRMLTAVGLDKK